MLDGKNTSNIGLPASVSTTTLRQQWQDNYNDLANLNEINRLGDKDADAALRKVAQQFESMFVSMMLKNMRSANDVFADEDSGLNSFAMKMHRDMYDQQLVLNISEGKGVGLAESFYQQLKGSYGRTLGIDAQEAVNLPTAVNLVEQLKQRLLNTAPPVESSALQTGGTAAPAETAPAITPDFSDKETFIKTLMPIAENTAKMLGVDAKVLLAQAALETGWGKYLVKDAGGNSTYNLFNIKADDRWQGDSASVATVEYREGVAQRERASFRQYQSFAESFADYANFITTNERYAAAVERAADPQAYLEALQKAGYATDPAYAEKIGRIFFNEFSDDLALAQPFSQEPKP